MATKDYAGDGITVHWDSDRCQHSQRCVHGLPAVFDPGSRPWVQVDQAAAEEIARVIDTCPSGALSYTRTDGAPGGRRGRRPGHDPAASIAADPGWEPGEVTAPAADTPAADAEPLVVVSPQVNGPLVVEGPFAIRLPDGSTRIVERAHLCRCGHSGGKPFCDGSHARVGFVAEGVAPRRRGAR